MSISVLVNSAGSEKDDALLNILMKSLEDISKKYTLKLERKLSKNIPAHLAPVLFCYAHDGKKMLFLLFDAIVTLGEKRLDVASKSPACDPRRSRGHPGQGGTHYRD